MKTLPRIRIAGDLNGRYVVLDERPNGQLKIAPEQTDELPRIATLERTTWACPTQWVAILADGRTVYARSRHGEFSVGVGDNIDDAVLNSRRPGALYFEYVEDSPMGFDELRAHLSMGCWSSRQTCRWWAQRSSRPTEFVTLDLPLDSPDS